MVGRTLTQHAVPITFGLKAAQWLHGILDARDDLRHERERLPIQVGGAAGTLAAPAELLRLSGSTADASALAHDLADRLGLRYSPPWHTSRAPVTRAADALVRATGAWGRIAADVLLLARPEIAELADEFRLVGERHAAEHEVFHTCHVLAAQCEQHAVRLEQASERYHVDLPDDDGGPWQGVLQAVRQKVSDVVGRTKEAGLVLLRDLRALWLAAEECSITWVMLGQAAKAVRDKELLELVTECHAETEIQVKWFVTRIKVASPQALVVG